MSNRVLLSIIIFLCILAVFVGGFSPKSAKTQSPCSIRSGEAFPSKDKIALIMLSGPIYSDGNYSFMQNPYSAEGVKEALRSALEDENIKGVLLRIDSPGGTVAATQEIYSVLLKVRKQKPVVVSMGDMAASGGYYISSAADRIYAENGTLTGSVGVIMNFTSFQELTKKIGVTSQVIKSGKYKDIGSSHRLLTKDDKILLQNIVDSTYKQFLTAIIQGRTDRKDNYKLPKKNLPVSTLKKYADGRVITGEQALQYGFVDNIGSIYDAETAIRELVKEKFGLEGLSIVEYNTVSPFEEFFMSFSETKTPIQNVIPFSAKYPKQPLLIWE